jgi:hypothetical protein
LQWTSDGERLWETLWKQQQQTNALNKRYRLHILTGSPRFAVYDKHAWCETHLNVELQLIDMVGPKKRHERQNFPKNQTKTTHPNNNNDNNNTSMNVVTKVIACHSSNKHRECKNHGDVLIDDRETLRTMWEQAGGVFVHHTSTETTLQRLTELGVLFSPNQEEKLTSSSETTATTSEQPTTTNEETTGMSASALSLSSRPTNKTQYNDKM